MPEMSGLELARQVKTLYPAIPIIVMSGTADGKDRDEIFSLSADFIPKPFDLADLLKRVARLLVVCERSGAKGGVITAQG
jgi:DNA-binding response OmpR family regulator